MGQFLHFLKKIPSEPQLLFCSVNGYVAGLLKGLCGQTLVSTASLLNCFLTCCRAFGW